MSGYEWIPGEAEEAAEKEAAGAVIKGAVGNALSDGDSVSIVKSLKIKGGSDNKIGTKVTGIRLLAGPVNDHDIEAKVPGAGQMYLKSSVVKKVYPSLHTQSRWRRYTLNLNSTTSPSCIM